MYEPNSPWLTTREIVVSCARGLTSFAQREAAALGGEILSSAATSFGVRGTLIDAMRLNLWLRTAHRVLWPLAEASALTLDHLYAHAMQVPWETWLDPDGHFTVHGAVHNDSIRDTRLPALRVKDAIADRMRDACGRRPDSGSSFEGAAIFVYWQGRDLRLYLDTTGEPLSKRGYRLQPGAAPLQETLAAACVLASEWDGTTPFVAPMCGSGTPAIEAALLASRRAPGAMRAHYTFMALRGFAEAAGSGVSPAESWQAFRAQAQAGVRSSGLPPIIATDLAPEAIRTARANAGVAAVTPLIAFSCCDFAATPLPPGPGTIFMNPAYGERLGDVPELLATYRRIGEFLQRAAGQGYRGHVLTGSRQLAEAIALPCRRRLPLFNGPIDCRLLSFDAPRGG